jgi:hypothetical protein
MKIAREKFIAVPNFSGRNNEYKTKAQIHACQSVAKAEDLVLLGSVPTRRDSNY